MQSCLCFQLTLLHSVSYTFFFYPSPSSPLCTVFDFISFNIDEVLSINPSANVFVFGDFNIHRKDWLTYSGDTDRPGEYSNNLLRWLAFLLVSLTVTLLVLPFLHLFLSSDDSICSTMVRKVITNLDSSKTSDPVCIPVVVLKNCEPELSYILAELFNMCLKDSCFPDC